MSTNPVFPHTPIENLPLSRVCLRKLANLEAHSLADLAAMDYQVIFEAIGHSMGSQLLQLIMQAGLRPNFKSPEMGEGDWHQIVQYLVDSQIVNWKEVALAILGELNPPQVGTAIASNPSFQRHFPPRMTMTNVMQWLYDQDGRCAICSTRLFLEADHIKSKQEYAEEGLDPGDADHLGNLQLLCKRCNVVKRSSHRLGGLSFGPASSVLMFILLRDRPRTKQQFYDACRAHGLTMANVRFDEAWAFAVWLAKEGKFEIDSE